MTSTVEIINELESAVRLANDLYTDYQTGRAVLTMSDAAAIHQALLKAQAATADLRPLVDAALAAAAARPES